MFPKTRQGIKSWRYLYYSLLSCLYQLQQERFQNLELVNEMLQGMMPSIYVKVKVKVKVNNQF